MHTPAVWMAWSLWRRHRLGLSAFLAYLVAVVVYLRLPSVPSSPVVLMAVCGPLGCGLLYFMGLFASPDADLITAGSTYPGHLFTAPVRTRTLVIWPMVYGTVSVALVWLFFASLVLASTGGSALIWWPAALLAALCTSLQALAWYPLPLPFLRGFLTALVLPGLAGLGGFAWLRGVGAWPLGIAYLALIPLCGLIATRGVTRARAGEARERSWWPATRAHTADAEEPTDAVGHRPFASPLRAQLWMECKRNGPILPLYAALLAVLLAIPALLPDSGPWKAIGIGAIEVHTNKLVWLLSLPLTALLAGMAGCCPRKADLFRPDLSLQPFPVTRPLSCLDLVAAKAVMAALSALTAWGILLICLCGWLLLPARDGILQGTIGGLLAHNLPPQAGWGLAALLAAGILVTCSSQVSILWIELLGRQWLVNLYALGIPLLMAATILWSVTNLPEHPELPGQALRLLPHVTVGLAGVKLLVLGGAFTALKKRRLASARTLATVAGVWLLAAGIVFALLLRYAPPGQTSPLSLLAGAVLFLPLARLSLAPLALQVNRHRG